MNPNQYEPDPKPNDQPPLWPLVIADVQKYRAGFTQLIEDMRSRDRFGREKYGVPLQPFNGRNPIRDAYQEALDLCVYMKQAMVEDPQNQFLFFQYYQTLDLLFNLSRYMTQTEIPK